MPFRSGIATSSTKQAQGRGSYASRKARAEGYVWTSYPSKRISRANAFNTAGSSSTKKTVAAEFTPEPPW